MVGDSAQDDVSCCCCQALIGHAPADSAADVQIVAGNRAGMGCTMG